MWNFVWRIKTVRFINCSISFIASDHLLFGCFNSLCVHTYYYDLTVFHIHSFILLNHRSSSHAISYVWLSTSAEVISWSSTHSHGQECADALTFFVVSKLRFLHTCVGTFEANGVLVFRHRLQLQFVFYDFLVLSLLCMKLLSYLLIDCLFLFCRWVYLTRYQPEIHPLFF